MGAVVAVVLVTAGAGYDFKRTPPTYLESATVVFSLPRSQDGPNAYLEFAPSLITSSEAMTQSLLSPRVQRQIREAGGTASVSLALVNLYDEEYPNYGVPFATLTVAAPSAANVRRTFVVAVRRLERLLAGSQESMGVVRRDRISDQIVGDTGPVIEAGSAKRVFAGLGALALVAISALWNYLGRRSASQARADASYHDDMVRNLHNERRPVGAR
jgi:hypothetical protein